MSHDLYDHRHYMIFNVSELGSIDFEVVQIGAEASRFRNWTTGRSANASKHN